MRAAVVSPSFALGSALIGLVLGVMAPASALADEVVVPPLVPRGATQVREVANITQLIASELDFMREVDRVATLDKVPAGYGYACLEKTSCLRPIGQANSGTHVLAGSLRVSESKVDLELVYYSVQSGRFVRRNTFTLNNTPEEIADSMGAIAREMVTGEAPKTDAAADDSFDLMDFDDEFEVDFDKEDFAAAAADQEAQKRAEEARRREAEARRRAEEEARIAKEAEERRLAQEEARRRAEEEARRKAEEERRLAAEETRRREEAEQRRRDEERRRLAEAAAEEERLRNKPEPEPEFDPNAISFGSASIIVEDDGSDSGPSIVTEEPERLDYYEESDEDFLDEPDEPDDNVRIADLDEPDPEPRRDAMRPPKDRTKPVREPKAKGPGFNDDPTLVTVALRAGYSPYFSLGFTTVGGELQVAAGDSGVHVVGGIQAYTIQRDVPEAMQQTRQAIREWNVMFPINVGVLYKASVAGGRVKPYGGADLVFAKYLAPPEGGLGSIAFGARARGGLDIMIVRNVGLTADVAVGGWAGKDDWQTIEPEAKSAGLLPQISAGTVIAF